MEEHFASVKHGIMTLFQKEYDFVDIWINFFGKKFHFTEILNIYIILIIILKFEKKRTFMAYKPKFLTTSE